MDSKLYNLIGAFKLLLICQFLRLAPLLPSLRYTFQLIEYPYSVKYIKSYLRYPRCIYWGGHWTRQEAIFLIDHTIYQGRSGVVTSFTRSSPQRHYIISTRAPLYLALSHYVSLVYHACEVHGPDLLLLLPGPFQARTIFLFESLGVKDRYEY